MAIKTLFWRMDAEIERVLFGFETDQESEISRSGGLLPRYTNDAVAAEAILRRIKADGGEVFVTEIEGITECFLLAPLAYDGWGDAEIRAKTGPLAIGIATLNAAREVMGRCGSPYVQLREMEELQSP